MLHYNCKRVAQLKQEMYLIKLCFCLQTKVLYKLTVTSEKTDTCRNVDKLCKSCCTW